MPSETRVPLMVPTYGEEEIAAVVEVLRSSFVTQGARVRQFEEAFHAFLGLPPSSSSMMVNSGSSANLVAAEMIAQRHEQFGGMRPRSEVVMPAVTWSTSVAPFLQRGFRPVFVDVGSDYQMNADLALGEVGEDTAAVELVHLLGWAQDVKRFWARTHDAGALLLEDCCEALGAMVNGRSVGFWGDYASFSSFFSHHLSTLEGGMLVFPSHEYRVRGIREHGWIRSYPAHLREALVATDPGLDEKYVFDTLGYNLRSTELNAAIGLVQLRRLGAFNERRRAIGAWYQNALQHTCFLLPTTQSGVEPCPFSFPVTIHEDAGLTRAEVFDGLAKAGVESRPIMSGNITRHPWFRRNKHKYRVAGELKRADLIHTNGFLLPIHPLMSDADLRYVRDVLNAILGRAGFADLPHMEGISEVA